VIPVARSEAEIADVVRGWKAQGHSVAFVPTMGSLHEGHRALVVAADGVADRVVVSIFVNPLQFGPSEDFERYPRNVDQDVAFLSDAPVDVLFCPSTEEVYPAGADVTSRVTAGPVGDTFEGATRPGHFDGVLTVVRRLCDMVAPDYLVMGEKDAQQVFLVTHVASRWQPPVEVVPVGTVRADDGLALSSRNAYLSGVERHSALAIPAALRAAGGQSFGHRALEAAQAILLQASGLELDYLAIVDPHTFGTRADEATGGEGLMIVAARVGSTRLIDNALLTFGH
jgi:pantoate--beta-alanine ligase